jgi:hypothetical protein
LNGEIKMNEYLYYGVAGAILLSAGYKLYRKFLADGKLTLDEIIEAVEEIKDVVDDLPSKSQLSKLKKDELIALCEERGVDTKGIKKELVERLLEATE